MSGRLGGRTVFGGTTGAVGPAGQAMTQTGRPQANQARFFGNRFAA
jgi:hypothetical protein